MNRSNRRIKLIIVDFYGVVSLGSYKNTARWIARKYRLPFEDVYKKIYFDCFTPAVQRKISEQRSYECMVETFHMREDWKAVRKKHLSYQKLNKPVFALLRRLQRAGYRILLLSKNTPPQFEEGMRALRIRRYFRNTVNTYDLQIEKHSPKMIAWIMRRFRVQPHEILMIDDQDFNLSAAQRMGAQTILYKNLKQLRERLRIVTHTV